MYRERRYSLRNEENTRCVCECIYIYTLVSDLCDIGPAIERKKEKKIKEMRKRILRARRAFVDALSQGHRKSRSTFANVIFAVCPD